MSSNWAPAICYYGIRETHIRIYQSHYTPKAASPWGEKGSLFNWGYECDSKYSKIKELTVFFPGPLFLSFTKIQGTQRIKNYSCYRLTFLGDGVKRWGKSRKREIHTQRSGREIKKWFPSTSAPLQHLYFPAPWPSMTGGTPLETACTLGGCKKHKEWC